MHHHSSPPTSLRMGRRLAAAALALLMLAAPQPSEAQFLKKLNQGLEKVNRGLEKANRALDPSQSSQPAQQKPKQDQAAATQATPAAGATRSAAAKPEYTTEQLREMAQKKVAMPHLTPQTRFMQLDVNYNSISQPSEGIFRVLQYNRDLGYSGYFSFFTVTGDYLFAPEWESPGEFPRFDSGAALAKTGKRNAAGKQPIYILYADGSVRELPVSVTETTQFYDGVAKVSYTEGRQMGIYYINTKGEKILPALAVDYDLQSRIDMTIENGARYIRDGRRAYYDNRKRKWGYLDAKGNIALQPVYEEVRDFSGGYALVIAKDAGGKEYPVFIDTAGKEIVRPPISAPTLQYAAAISDIDSGMFINYNDFTFYDLQGQPVRKYESASQFFDGYAFVQERSDKPYVAVNSSFEPERDMSLTSLGTMASAAFQYSEAGVVTVGERKVFTPDGYLILSAGYEHPRYGHVGTFSADGYATCDGALPWGDKRYQYAGITDLAGNILVAFSKDKEAGEGDPSELEPIKPVYPEPIERGPEPSDTLPKLPIPPKLGLPKIDDTPKGPKQVNDVTYAVTVKAQPAEAATVTGSGRYHYADKFTIDGKVNPGWLLAGVENPNPYILVGNGSEYEVRGNGEITLLFVKDETVTPGSGAYAADLKGLRFNDTMTAIPDMTIYLEMDASSCYSSPYGERTGGVFTIINDPMEPINGQLSRNGQPKEGSLWMANVFPVPMRVDGISKTADGRQWLVVDGGTNILANTMVLSTGAKANDVSALEALMMNLMMYFDGFDTASISSAHYRIEMLDIDPQTGEFTFGELQRLSPYGWVPGGDQRIISYEKGFFVTKVDRGLSADFVKGLRMKPVQGGRKLLWTPPAEFYGSPEQAEQALKKMGENYRQFVSEHEHLKSLNGLCISAALDALLR